MVELEENLTRQVLLAFPRRVSIDVTVEDLAIKLSERFESFKELRNYVDELVPWGYVSQRDTSWCITDYGLDFIAQDASPEQYVIRKICEHDGSLFIGYLIDSKFKNELAKAGTIRKLIGDRMIE